MMLSPRMPSVFCKECAWKSAQWSNNEVAARSTYARTLTYNRTYEQQMCLLKVHIPHLVAHTDDLSWYILSNEQG